MKRIELGSPSKRPVELHVREFRYPTISREYLAVPKAPRNVGFFATVESRRSRRTFGPMSKSALSALLWYSSKTLSTWVEPNGFRWEHRPAPSAGGRHPVDLLVVSDNRAENVAYIYDPFAHALNRIQIQGPGKVTGLVREVNNIVSCRGATIIWHLAQFARTLSKYVDGESLVWRDAGALLATMGLVAEALRLSFCAIGITGEPWVSEMLDSKGAVVGVGGCIVGSRRREK